MTKHYAVLTIDGRILGDPIAVEAPYRPYRMPVRTRPVSMMSPFDPSVLTCTALAFEWNGKYRNVGAVACLDFEYNPAL